MHDFCVPSFERRKTFYHYVCVSTSWMICWTSCDGVCRTKMMMSCYCCCYRRSYHYYRCYCYYYLTMMPSPRSKICAASRYFSSTGGGERWRRISCAAYSGFDPCLSYPSTVQLPWYSLLLFLVVARLAYHYLDTPCHCSPHRDLDLERQRRPRVRGRCSSDSDLDRSLWYDDGVH